MKDNTAIWWKYANENLESAKVLLKSQLYNPCLQNVQQAIEKGLKALLYEVSLNLKKTHSISELNSILEKQSIQVGLTDEECDLLDYLVFWRYQNTKQLHQKEHPAKHSKQLFGMLFLPALKEGQKLFDFC